jgi:hypothetical protein
MQIQKWNDTGIPRCGYLVEHYSMMVETPIMPYIYGGSNGGGNP